MDAAIAAFTRLVDYAGLYPPAGLSIDIVVRNYGRYRGGAHDWMLGRLILPASQLLDANALATAAGATPETRWPVSALVGGFDVIEASRRHVLQTRDREDAVLAIESIETSAATTADVEALARAWPADLERFVELPHDADADVMRALAGTQCLAKLRTGGVTADRFPSTDTVARFMSAALRGGVPMKATAGLHHAIRGSQPMTYEPGSARAVMHGFANLVFAAALLVAGKIDADVTEALLDDDRPEVFRFGGRAGSWLNAVLTYGELAEGRRQLLRSVGSCSFDEPVQEAQALDWIA